MSKWIVFAICWIGIASVASAEEGQCFEGDHMAIKCPKDLGQYNCDPNSKNALVKVTHECHSPTFQWEQVFSQSLARAMSFCNQQAPNATSCVVFLDRYQLMTGITCKNDGSCEEMADKSPEKVDPDKLASVPEVRDVILAQAQTQQPGN